MKFCFTDPEFMFWVGVWWKERGIEQVAGSWRCSWRHFVDNLHSWTPLLEVISRWSLFHHLNRLKERWSQIIIKRFTSSNIRKVNKSYIQYWLGYYYWLFNIMWHSTKIMFSIGLQMTSVPLTSELCIVSKVRFKSLELQSEYMS